MRRTTCASNLAMSSPRPRSRSRSRSRLNPNSKPFPFPFPIPSTSTSTSFHRWRRSFSPSATGSDYSDLNIDSGPRQESGPHPQQRPPRLGFRYAPRGPYTPPPGGFRPPSPSGGGGGGGYAVPPGSFRPPLQGFHPPPRPRPPDYRSWIPTRSPPPPPQHERFKVLSYNILADYLARNHQSELYFHIPRHILDWEWRKRRILLEFGLWSADIMCLQEVDRFSDLQEELALRGYQGIWKMRTGTATDGCAIFWRTNRFQLRHEEYIEFNKHGLRDNVAQICVLESRSQQPMRSNSAAASSSPTEFRGSDQVVVCNIHVLYNPKRGEVKLGQARLLIDRALAVSRHWNNAPVIICGDFNSTPKSPLYDFILEQKLDLSGLRWDQVSGQHSCVQTQAYRGDSLRRVHICQESSDVKATAVEAGNSNVKIPNEHKASDEAGINKSPAYLSISEAQVHAMPETVKYHNILEKDVQAPDSIRQVTDDISQLNISDAKVKVTIDTSVEAAVEDCGYHDPINQNDNVRRATFAKEVRVTKEVSPGQTLESSACVQMLSQSVSIVNEPKLQPDIKVFSSDIHTSVEKEESFNSSSGASSCKALELASVQELVLSSSKTDMKEMDEVVFDSDRDISKASKEMGMHKNDGNQHVISNNLQDCRESSNNWDEPVFKKDSGGWDFNSSTIFSKGNDLDENIDDSFEEISDPNFLAELHGKKSIDELNEEETAASDKNMQTQFNSCSEIRVWSSAYDPFHWTPEQIETATGNAECSVLLHDLKLKSAYTEAKDFAGTKDPCGEPEVTSYNRKFMGTVDYIWFSESLQTVKVLDTIRKDVLQQTSGFPTQKWGSDHIAIACEFALSRKPADGM